MIYLVFGLLLWRASCPGQSAHTHPGRADRASRRFGGFVLLVGLAGLLLLTGRVHAMSQVLALVGHAWRRRGAFRPPPGFDDVSGMGSGGAGGPAIRTRYLDMRLDEATGAIEGQFTAGPYAGATLAPWVRVIWWGA